MARYNSQHRLIEAFNDMFDDHATPECPDCIELSFFGTRRFLNSREPEHIKTVLTTKFADFGKGPDFHKIWAPFLGDSIFTTDGKAWQDSRALIRPMFITNRVRDLDIFQHWADLLLTKIPASGKTVNIMDLFYRMTLDATTDFLLGSGVNSLDK